MRWDLNEGFSGLEAAIVLIAFVVVATIFSYSVLGAGFFASEKTSGVAHSGIKQSMSSLILEGMIYGEYGADGVSSIALTLAVPEGGTPQDLEKVKMIWSIRGQNPIELVHGKTGIITDDTKRYLTGIPIPVGYRPLEGETFTLQIMPEFGSSCLITRDLKPGYRGGVIY